MATLAIVGAGPGLGAAVARRFGREGFAIALVSRDQTKLDAMAAEFADGVRWGAGQREGAQTHLRQDFFGRAFGQ